MTRFSTWGLIGLLFATGSALAQTPPTAPDPAISSVASVPASELSEAEVRKIDLSAGTVTLKHGEIKNLDMPPMSMVFKVKDPALLTQVKAGDKVRFTADKINGAYMVLTLERAH